MFDTLKRLGYNLQAAPGSKEWGQKPVYIQSFEQERPADSAATKRSVLAVALVLHLCPQRAGALILRQHKPGPPQKQLYMVMVSHTAEQSSLVEEGIQVAPCHADWRRPLPRHPQACKLPAIRAGHQGDCSVSPTVCHQCGADDCATGVSTWPGPCLGWRPIPWELKGAS